MPNALVTAVQSLTAGKQRLATQERELITALNHVLAGIGYQVVAKAAASASPRVTQKPATRGRRKSLACPHCERRFAQPVHLGRHVSATHRAQKKVVALKVVKATASGKTARRATSERRAKATVAKVGKAAKPRPKMKPPVKKGVATPATEKPGNSGSEGATR